MKMPESFMEVGINKNNLAPAAIAMANQVLPHLATGVG
jgi:hypothetical protein